MRMSATSSMLLERRFMLTYIIICQLFNAGSYWFQIGPDMLTINNCIKHSDKEISHICLAEDCKEEIFMCEECIKASHRHSKTDIRLIQQIKGKLKDAWEPKNSAIQPYFSKVKQFYNDLRVQIKDLLDLDERRVEYFITKVKYYHLPTEANSQAYLEFMKDEYDRLDKASIVNLVNQAENGELNKNLQKQKQISDFLDLQLKRAHEKVLTLKYVLLSKKLKTELLMPTLTEPSKVASHDEFVKIYSFFNARNLMIRSAKLIYRGSENDYSPKSFYNCCNGVSNCMAIAKTKKNLLVGGFSPLSLVHHDEDQLTEQGLQVEDKTKRSFIFNISHLKSYNLKNSRKALKYKNNWPGPSFGEDLDFGESITSSMGHSYECQPQISIDSLEAKVCFLQTQKASIREFQIWQLSF